MTGITAVSNQQLQQTLPAEQAHTHTIEYGDSLASITKTYGVTPEQMLQVNPQINNPEVIYPGDNVVVPDHQRFEASEASDDEPGDVDDAPVTPPFELTEAAVVAIEEAFDQGHNTFEIDGDGNLVASSRDESLAEGTIVLNLQKRGGGVTGVAIAINELVEVLTGKSVAGWLVDFARSATYKGLVNLADYVSQTGANVFTISQGPNGTISVTPSTDPNLAPGTSILDFGNTDPFDLGLSPSDIAEALGITEPTSGGDPFGDPTEGPAGSGGYEGVGDHGGGGTSADDDSGLE